MIIKYIPKNGKIPKTAWEFTYMFWDDPQSSPSIIINTSDLGKAMKIILKEDLLSVTEDIEHYFGGEVESGDVAIFHSFMDHTMSGEHDYVLRELKIVN